MFWIPDKLAPVSRLEPKPPVNLELCPQGHQNMGCMATKTQHFTYVCVHTHNHIMLTGKYPSVECRYCGDRERLSLRQRSRQLQEALPSHQPSLQKGPNLSLHPGSYSTSRPAQPHPRPHRPAKPVSYKHSSKLSNTLQKQRDKSRKWGFLQDRCEKLGKSMALEIKSRICFL